MDHCMAGLQFRYLDWIKLLHYVHITTYFHLWSNNELTCHQIYKNDFFFVNVIEAA